MSIEVVCSNGHRLKVKDHWAGKSGRCPRCKVKISVPETITVSDNDVLAMIGEYRPSKSGVMDAGGRPHADPDDDQHNALDEYDEKMLKATSGLSLLGSAVVKHKKKCRHCGRSSNLWFASCEYCGEFFQE